MTVKAEIQALLADEKCFEYESEISRNPFKLKSWLRYLNSNVSTNRKRRNILFERALKFLPNSYKLWYGYLTERLEAVEEKCPTDQSVEVVINTFERALVHLHKMPVIWVLYLEFISKLGRVTNTRRAFDRALQSLPITQHEHIWPIYLNWVKTIGVKETAIRVYRRYLMYDSTNREEYVDYLEEVEEWDEAANQLAICVNDDKFVSPQNNTKHQVWMRLCDICAKHPNEVGKNGLNVDAIIRSGLKRFSDEVGRLWCKLADYYIRLGQFERARDVYEEGINSVITVRDFTMIFDAYTQFEESVLTAKMQLANDEDSENDEKTDSDSDLDDDGDDIELRLARLENLLERRPLLISSVLLRQNPHNVHEWQKRAKLILEEKKDPKKVLICYAEAVKTVNPKLAVGKLCDLWIEFAKFYEDHKDFENVRIVFEKALLPHYRNVDDLATVWCAYADFELRNDNFKKALQLMQRATTEPQASVERRRYAGGNTNKTAQKLWLDAPVQERVFKSTKVWNMYLDLEESIGKIETTRAAYDKAMEIKVCTPQMILNYASYLEENKYFEESFAAYEKGVGFFSFPHVKPIWKKYLDKFVERYAGTKLERARDLFEQVLQIVPAKDSPEFYIRYIHLEEHHGLVRNATVILDRACSAVIESDRLDMFKLYIAKVEQYYGVTQTRTVYEKALDKLKEDQDCREICLQFASLEQGLGEIDRARAILTHGSQFADPRRHDSYWKVWHEFEVAHGNEQTFREMLRVKRSVQMSFSAVNYMTADMTVDDIPIALDADAMAEAEMKETALQKREETVQSGSSTGTKRKVSEMEAIERQVEKIKMAKESRVTEQAAEEANENPEEIDIDDDVLELVEKQVPENVFGSIKDSKGALERIRGKQ
mmetsp:Transcript_2417/g.3520  ORF Transcript_2417/g.3520 Transcript_2417/m.3520 type:complete len:886 (+) Transcript_2417:38-2695(+)